MTTDEPMSTPDSGGLREAVEALADRWKRENRRPSSPSDQVQAGIWSATNADAAELRALLAAHPEPVPTPDSADDATVGEHHWTCGGCGYEGNGPDNVEWTEHTKVCPDLHPATPPAEDANRAPVSGGLDEGERSAIVKALYHFPHAGAKWLTFRNGVWAAVERILATRDAAWVERLAAVEGERDELREVLRIGTELDNHHNADRCPYCVGGVKARAEAAEAERDTARREAGERIAVAIEAERDKWDARFPVPEGWDLDYILRRHGTYSGLDRAARIARADALTSDDGSGA